MARKNTKFADTIFVKWTEADVDFRSVEDAAENFAETDEVVEVGEYKLVGVRKVRTRIEVA